MNSQINKLKLSIGSDNFRKMVSEHDVYVDKTMFIKEIIDSGEEAILLTKMRRWGKTLNLDMLKTFFSIEVGKEGNALNFNSNKILFSGGNYNSRLGFVKKLEQLEIAKVDEGSYMQYQGKYPVIFISLKEVTGSSIEEIEHKLNIEIKKLFREHEYLKNSDKLSSYFKADLNKYFEGNIKEIDLRDSIRFLSELLYKHHNQKVYILIDEYDKPVNNILEKGVTEDNKILIHNSSELITSLLSSCGKTNSNLEKIILTGIFDTLKKEGGSGFNNINVYGITDIRYGTSFGFSENEIEQLLTKIDFKENTALVKENIKNWYNGYTIPISNTESIQVYTPWAVMNYLNSAYYNNFQPENYWSKSGASIILQSLLKANVLHKELIEKFNHITEENEVKLNYDKSTSLFRYELTPGKYSEEIFTYLLVNSGYLTIKKVKSEYFFKIPNFEVKKEFIDVIKNEIQNTESSLSNEQNLLNISLLNVQKDILLKHYSVLVYNNEIIKLYNFIQAGNHTESSKVLNQDSIKCEENLNFLYIGAVSGNKNIFLTLLNKCGDNLLQSKDSSGLKPIDYAYLLHNYEIIDVIKSKNHDIDKLNQPNFLYSIYCHEYFPTLTVLTSILTGSIKYLGKLKPVISSLENYNFTPYIVTISLDYALSKIKDFKKGIDTKICNNYDEYYSIDLDSLQGFKKYMLTHPDAYVTTNSSCNKDYKVASKPGTLLSYEKIETIDFTLCGKPQEEYHNSDILLDSVLFLGAFSTLLAFPLLLAAGCSSYFEVVE